MHSGLIIRINKVIDHIEKHISEEHSLEKLAEIANLSKFHFHRTFKFITQETPNDYITRKRIEKIASLLVHDPKQSIAGLSFYYGFQNLSSFSRSFKKYFGFSASQLRKRVKNRTGIDPSLNSKIGKTTFLSKTDLSESEKLKEWMASKAAISVKVIPEVSLAFIRHWGSPYTIHKAFDKLLDWCKAFDNNQIGDDYFTLFHDNPSLTIDYKIQQSACVETKNIVSLKHEISVLKIPSQKYLIGKFELNDREFEMAWNSMIFWLNKNNLRAKDGHRFERFLNNSLFDDSPTYQVEIGIPII